ncbi:MAG: hypothetical protein NVSMB17_13510 [Candidatus Dormibacteria bacterium]
MSLNCQVTCWPLAMVPLAGVAARTGVATGTETKPTTRAQAKTIRRRGGVQAVPPCWHRAFIPALMLAM